MSNTMAATPIAMTALSRRPRATPAVKRMGERACARDSAKSYGSGEEMETDYDIKPRAVPVAIHGGGAPGASVH
jgi:hypothetical protein